MILSEFKAFPRVGRIIGVDWGASRTGVAITDGGREFFFTRDAIVSANRGADLPARVAEFAAAEGAAGIVVGLPLRGDGTESETTAAVREFAGHLSRLTDLPIIFIDETLSSFAAAEDMGLKSRNAAKTKLDSESARLILENAVAMLKRTF